MAARFGPGGPELTYPEEEPNLGNRASVPPSQRRGSGITFSGLTRRKNGVAGYGKVAALLLNQRMPAGGFFLYPA